MFCEDRTELCTQRGPGWVCSQPHDGVEGRGGGTTQGSGSCMTCSETQCDGGMIRGQWHVYSRDTAT